MGHSLKNLNLVETEFFAKQITQKFVESIEVLATRFERGGGRLESGKMSGHKGLSSSVKSGNISCGEPRTNSSGSASNGTARTRSGSCILGNAIYL